MVPTASALFTAASSDELRAAGMRLGNEDAPDNGAAYLIRDLDGVAAQLPPAEAELAKALDGVGFERVMIEFESPGPLGTPFAHNKLVALERRPGPTASLIKYLELTGDGRPRAVHPRGARRILDVSLWLCFCECVASTA